MQINGAASHNPAAAALQAISSSKGSEAHLVSSPTNSSVNSVEGAQQTSDRDADGQYLGDTNPEGRNQNSRNNELAEEKVEPTLVDLPADDGESHQLDCWG